MSDDLRQSALEAFYGRPNYRRAAHLLRKLVESGEADAEVFRFLARCAVELDPWSDETEQWLKRARAAGSDDTTITIIRAHFCCARNDYTRASELLSHVMEAASGDWEVLHMLAKCAIQLDPHSAQVEEWIQRADAAGLEKNRVSYLRSVACSRRGEASAAYEYALRAAQEGYDPYLLEWVAFTALEVRSDAAKLAAEAAIDQFPRHPGGYSVLGQLAFRENRYMDAIRLLKRAAELGPNRVDSYYWLGETYSRIGDYANAESSYNAALDLNCGNRPDVLVRLAICAKKGRMDRAEARALCQEALALCPDHAGATELLSELDSGTA